MLGQRSLNLATGGKFSSAVIFPEIIVKGAPLSLGCIFDDTFYDSTLGENALEGAQIRVTIQLAQFVANGIARGNPCTVNGVAYSVLEPQPDLGTGICVLTLSHEPNNPEAD